MFRGCHYAPLVVCPRRGHRAAGDPVIGRRSSCWISTIAPGDVVGIGIHTANAGGYEVGRGCARGAWVAFAEFTPPHPDEAHEQDCNIYVAWREFWEGRCFIVWSGIRHRFTTAAECLASVFRRAGTSRRRALHVACADRLGPPGNTACSVRWRTDGQELRQRGVTANQNWVELRGGDSDSCPRRYNFYPVTFDDRARPAARIPHRLQELERCGGEVRAHGRLPSGCRATSCSIRRLRWKPGRIRSSSTR